MWICIDVLLKYWRYINFVSNWLEWNRTIVIYWRDVSAAKQKQMHILKPKFSSDCIVWKQGETEQSEARQLVWSNNIVMFMFLVHRV